MNKIKIDIVNFDEKHANAISEIIIQNLKEINAKDYSIEKINELVDQFIPTTIIKYSKERKVFVAVIDDKPVGTLSVQKSWEGLDSSHVFLTIFVDINYHKFGIGNLLINQGEEYVQEQEGNSIYIPSSIYAHKFYLKNGYEYLNDSLDVDQYGCIPMQKNF